MSLAHSLVGQQHCAQDAEDAPPVLNSQADPVLAALVSECLYTSFPSGE